MNRKGDVNRVICRDRRGSLSLLEIIIFTILLLAVLYMLLSVTIKYFNRGDIAFSAATACQSPTGAQGECLNSFACNSRSGWRVTFRYTCDEGLTCCILEEPKEWFTPGSVIVNTLAHDLKLSPPDTSSKSEPVNSLGPIKLKQPFSIIYVPKESDKSCKITIKGATQKEFSHPAEKTCADLAIPSWPIPRGVLLVDRVTPTELQKEVGFVEAGWSVILTVDGTTVEYPNVLKIVK